MIAPGALSTCPAIGTTVLSSISTTRFLVIVAANLSTRHGPAVCREITLHDMFRIGHSFCHRQDFFYTVLLGCCLKRVCFCEQIGGCRVVSGAEVLGFWCCEQVDGCEGIPGYECFRGVGFMSRFMVVSRLMDVSRLVVVSRLIIEMGVFRICTNEEIINYMCL